jgi:hypothetical protein
MLAVATAAVVLAVSLGLWVTRSRGASNPNPAGIEMRERQVTSNPIETPIFFAAISADGRYVAYSDGRGLHIRFIDTGETRTVPVPPEFCFT